MIIDLFVRIHMEEQVRSGVGRIKDQMKDAGLPEPQFKTEGMFTVVLQRNVKETVEKAVVEIPLSETAKKMIKLIKKQPGITTKELGVALDIADKAAG